MRVVILLFLLSRQLTCFSTEDQPDWRATTEQATYIHQSIKQITDIMVYDIYSPPVASRTYAYICVAGYEATANADKKFASLAGKLHGLTPLPAPEAGRTYSYTLAAVQAILAVGRTMVISEKSVDSFYNKITAVFKNSGMPADVYENSISFGKAIAKHIITWAASDNYKQTRSLSRYSVNDEAATWKPTPPAYMKAVEPHWNKIRTFVIDSAQQFKPSPPPVFSTDKGSDFYKEAMAVHDIGNALTADQKNIANFWDCNPFKMNISGHVMFASKKISPGGHWINITKLACELKTLGTVQSLQAYAYTAVAIADAFISCWDEKYRSLLIRPETYINQYIDADWLPVLQTPPFPEYTSGHSILSNAAAVMLEDLLGKNFSYADSTENEFGIPVRHFSSFTQAADEAAISRFYGGIHYMPAIVTGSEKGRKIGVYVLERLKTNLSSFSNSQ